MMRLTCAILASILLLMWQLGWRGSPGSRGFDRVPDPSERREILPPSSVVDRPISSKVGGAPRGNVIELPTAVIPVLFDLGNAGFSTRLEVSPLLERVLNFTSEEKRIIDYELAIVRDAIRDMETASKVVVKDAKEGDYVNIRIESSAVNALIDEFVSKASGVIGERASIIAEALKKNELWIQASEFERRVYLLSDEETGIVDLVAESIIGDQNGGTTKKIILKENLGKNGFINGAGERYGSLIDQSGWIKYSEDQMWSDADPK